MKAQLKDGKLILTLDVHEPRTSKSGKTKSIASTAGFKPTDVEVDGKLLMVSVNTYLKNG